MIIVIRISYRSFITSRWSETAQRYFLRGADISPVKILLKIYRCLISPFRSFFNCPYRRLIEVFLFEKFFEESGFSVYFCYGISFFNKCKIIERRSIRSWILNKVDCLCLLLRSEQRFKKYCQHLLLFSVDYSQSHNHIWKILTSRDEKSRYVFTESKTFLEYQ